VQEGHEFKVIVTNKTTAAGKVARFHEGRGYQEKIYGELKNQAQMGYVPARRLVANKVYLLCSLLAHNLSRELQLQVEEPVRGTTQKRTVKMGLRGTRYVASQHHCPGRASNTSIGQINIDPQRQSDCPTRTPSPSPCVIL
jgi:hypothetical protein